MDNQGNESTANRKKKSEWGKPLSIIGIATVIVAVIAVLVNWYRKAPTTSISQTSNDVAIAVTASSNPIIPTQKDSSGGQYNLSGAGTQIINIFQNGTPPPNFASGQITNLPVQGSGENKIKKAVEALKDSSSTNQEVYYTPVSTSLRKMGQILGDYLHSIKQYRKCTDPWWRETRSFLEQVYRELEFANIGTLLGPPLVNPETGQIHVTVEGLEEDDLAHLMGEMMPGKNVVLDIQYIDAFPNPQRPPD